MAKSTNGQKADWIFKGALTLVMFVLAWYVAGSKEQSATVSSNTTRITVIETDHKHFKEKVDGMAADLKELLLR